MARLGASLHPSSPASSAVAAREPPQQLGISAVALACPGCDPLTPWLMEGRVPSRPCGFAGGKWARWNSPLHNRAAVRALSWPSSQNSRRDVLAACRSRGLPTQRPAQAHKHLFRQQWSHYNLLARIENPQVRERKMIAVARQQVRQAVTFPKHYTLRSVLSWDHYLSLMRIENPAPPR